MAETPPLLEVDGVTLQYKTRHHLITATYRVGFKVHAADRFVLLGPSGCGKSTLLKAVGGYLAPVEGSIRLKGQVIRRPGSDRIMVFQEFDQLLPWKTVKENVAFPLVAARGLPARQARDKAMQAIAKVNLTKFADSYPHTLSGGMKQRVAIARALAMEPDILLMDEPFAALDALTRQRMQEELLQLWEGTRFTVLFVTHSIPEAIKLGNRILLLSPHPGRVRAELNSDGTDASDRRAGSSSRSASTASSLPTPMRQARWPMPSLEPSRPEFVTPGIDQPMAAVIEKPLTLAERLYGSAFSRKLAILALLCVIWQIYAASLDNPLLLPSFTATARALFQAILSGGLLARAALSLKVLLMGYAAGLALAMLLSAFAVSSRIGSDLLETLTAMFNPLPSIALLPIALLWFGLGNGSTIFVLIHSVLWPVALNTHAGFTAVSTTLRMVGRNYGLRGPRYVAQILDPRRLPEHPRGPQDRLGLRLAHPHRRRAHLRRHLGLGRARLVHLRAQERSRHPRRLRRAGERHHHRTPRRERHLPQPRGGDRTQMGHAALGPINIQFVVIPEA